MIAVQKNIACLAGEVLEITIMAPVFLKQTHINRFMSCKYPDLFQSAVDLL